jgi:virulence factor Mce-like protein
MNITAARRRILPMCMSVLLVVTGCSFRGVNSLPLPGTVGRERDAVTYHVELANIGTLESNSPVMVDDVVVGSVGAMTFRDWHVDLAVSVRPDAVIPANAQATVGQTSLLGSMHVALNPQLGQQPEGRLRPGAIIPLSKSSTYPSTEQTLSALAAIVNGGGLGQIGDIIHSANEVFSGRQDEIRDLLTRLDTFVGTLDQQRFNIIATIDELNRFSSTLAGQQQALTRALDRIPPALDVLVRERPRLTTALDRLRVFADTISGVIDDTQADLVTNLTNLEPTLKALADIGPDIDTALAYLTVFPYGQNTIDRGIRGDYMNLFVTLDITHNRLKRGLLASTRWGKEYAPIVPAPGDPGYDQYYNTNPLGAPIAPALPPPAAVPLPAEPPPPTDGGAAVAPPGGGG